MGMAVGSGEGGLVSDINVTPMVDVMLVLLIIFMVIAPMLQSGVSVALPKSKNPDADANIIKETSAVIAVPTDTEVYFGRDKVNKEDLANILKDKLKDKFKDKPPNEQIVYIKSGVNVKYETVVNVINAVRDAGYDKIGLVAEKDKVKGGGGGGA
jgi:biopolymer transport protein TolR